MSTAGTSTPSVRHWALEIPRSSLPKFGHLPLAFGGRHRAVDVVGIIVGKMVLDGLRAIAGELRRDATLRWKENIFLTPCSSNAS